MAATYGTYDLRLLYHRNLSIGLSFGVGLILLFSAATFTMHVLSAEPPAGSGGGTTATIKDNGIKIESIDIKQHGSPQAPGQGEKPEIGTPVAVSDSLAPKNTVLATQDDPVWDAGKVDPDSAGNGTIRIEPTIDPDPEPDPTIFVPVEEEPKVIRSATPAYPEIARRAGIEGRVVVKALVGKDGRVRRAIILYSDAEALNQPSLDAMAQYVFSPAIMNNGPVMAWISVPFNFRLR